MIDQVSNDPRREKVVMILLYLYSACVREMAYLRGTTCVPGAE
jgi:hypothetical protein